MAFPRKLLTDGEEVILELRQHWKALFFPTLWTILIWPFVAWAEVQMSGDVPGAVQWVVVAVAVILWAAIAGGPMLEWRFTEYALTNERLIAREGIIAKRAKEIPLETINDITFTQTVLDRILRSGDLVLESAGENGHQEFDNIAAPAAVQKRIYEATEVRKETFSGREGAASVADELAKFAALRDQGVISAEEFEARKRRLLES